MARRGESIYKRKDGRWEARYVRSIGADGKKKYASVYAKSYAAVKDKQQYYKNVAAEKRLCSQNLLVGQIAQEWMRFARGRLKQSSYLKYESLCKHYILPKLGHCSAARISRERMCRFAEECKQETGVRGRPLAPKTVNDILATLSGIFSFAAQEYDITFPKIPYLREEKKEARVLTVTEQKTLTDYLLQNLDIYKLGVLVALYTGLRIGELCALEWSDVLEDRILITKTLQRLKEDSGHTVLHIGLPKSPSSYRSIPLPECISAVLGPFRKQTGLLLSTPRYARIEPRVLQQHFKKIAQACGLCGATFHTLRHTFATRCIEADFDIKSLSEILGHADVKTTLNRYVHASFALKQKNMNKLTLLVG